MTEADTRLILCIPDEHKERILELLESEENKANGFVHLTDKNGVVMKFYKNQGNLWADRADGETIIQQPVITMSEAQKVRESQRPFKDKIIERIQSDFPEKSKEEVERDADILNEANESIKKLVASGVAPSVARKIIANVLDCAEPPSTPEEMAEFIAKMSEEVVKKED